MKTIVQRQSDGETSANVSDKLPALVGVGLNYHLHKLTPVMVAESLDRHWPNMFKAATACGVTHSAFSYHKARTPWFQRIYAEVEAKHNGAVEQVLYNRGVSGDEYTFNDRCMYLKAHMPELYDRAKVIKLEDNRVPHREALARAKAVESIIDAEIVESFRTKKAKRQRRGT